MKKDLINLTDLSISDLNYLIDKAIKIKTAPALYSQAMQGKNLLLVFEKPSLRTRVSFDSACSKMGGHPIYLDVTNTPISKGETLHDTAKCVSSYVDIIVARLLKQSNVIELAKYSEVPVIDGLSEMSHPCQAVADFMTIKEKKGKFNGLKLTYFGDARNNVTYSLLQGCAMLGINMELACPLKTEYLPQKEILDGVLEISKRTGAKISIVNDPNKAALNSDVIVTDTWMSYHISVKKEKERISTLKPYQVTPEIMNKAKKDAIFMHCLPCRRGYEVTANVADGNHSVIFEEAENRLWTEMAILMFLTNKSM